MGMGRTGALTAILLASLALAQTAAAQAPVKAPGQDDYCGAGCFDVLPPGTKGNNNVLELSTFLSTGNRPRHTENQRDLYGDLIYDYRSLVPTSLDRHFKRHNFGVPPDQVERSYSPHPDVTVISPPDGDGDVRVPFTGGRAFLEAKRRGKDADRMSYDGPFVSLDTVQELARVLGPDTNELGTLTEHDTNGTHKLLPLFMGVHPVDTNCP
jgi:hypothetical protein